MIIGRSWDTTGTRVCETGFTASGRWNASWTGGHAQAAKALAFWIPERPKAKAVGYLEAKTQPLVLHGYAGADDAPDGAEQFGVEATVVADGILVEADLFAELLGVEGPALGVGAEAGVEAEFGQALELLLDGELHVVTGNAFVVGDGFI